MKIFSKKKFAIETGKCAGVGKRHWASTCDGREVVRSNINGTIYHSEDGWCVDSEPLMERFKTEKIAVRFTEEWQRDTFLKMCEEAGLEWRGGDKPTKYKPRELREPIVSGFIDFEGDYLACVHPCFLGSGWHIISYLDFINSAADTKTKQKPENKKYNITITSDGKTTMAVFKVDGKTVKTATAKCNPSDRFDFHAGAELAFDRLFEKQHKNV